MAEQQKLSEVIKPVLDAYAGLIVEYLRNINPEHPGASVAYHPIRERAEKILSNFTQDLVEKYYRSPGPLPVYIARLVGDTEYELKSLHRAFQSEELKEALTEILATKLRSLIATPSVNQENS